MSNPILDAARAELAKQQEKIKEVLSSPTDEARALTDDEAEKFEKYTKRSDKLIAQIKSLEAEEARKAAATKAAADLLPAGDSVVRRERMTYDPAGYSYMRDLAAIMVPEAGMDRAAAEARMIQHHKEIDIESRKAGSVAARVMAEVRSRSLGSEDRAAFEARVNPNTTAGTGGEFVPPLWLVSQFVPYLRPDRTFANRVMNKPLPPGIDVINIPKITVGSQTAIQPAQGQPVASVDIQTSTVSAPVNTISGQEDISLQLLEQSPLAMDGVIFDDLGRDYDQRLDLQVIAGTGTNGQHSGVLNVSGQTSNSSIT